MSETEVKCADLVQGNYKRECEHLNGLIVADDEDDSIFDYGLSFEWQPSRGESCFTAEPGYFCWLLSWGGPQDEFRFFVDADLTLYKVEYWYLDWNDGARVRVPIGKDRPEWLTYMWNMWEDTDTLKQLIEREKME